MGKLTYLDKVALNENPDIPDINKVKAQDMNEIKNVVNTNDDTVQGIINGEKYSTTEVKTNKVWINNKPIYRKVVYDTTSRSAGNYNIEHGIQNYDEIVSYKTLCYQSSSVIHDASSTSSLSGSERVTSYFNNSNISIRTSWAIVKTIIIIEYTKTTD